MSKTPSSTGDTMIPCTIETRDRVREIIRKEEELRKGSVTYDRFLNDMCDQWEKRKK